MGYDVGEVINDIAVGMVEMIAVGKRRSGSESHTIRWIVDLGIFGKVLRESGEESNERRDKLICILK
jgi:hypothetical protein